MPVCAQLPVDEADFYTLDPDMPVVREAVLSLGRWSVYLVLHVDCGLDAWSQPARYDATCQTLAARCQRIMAALGVVDFEFQGTTHGLGEGEGFWEWLTFGTLAFQIGIPWPQQGPPAFIPTAIEVVEAEVRLALQASVQLGQVHHFEAVSEPEELFFVATHAA